MLKRYSPSSLSGGTSGGIQRHNLRPNRAKAEFHTEGDTTDPSEVSARAARYGDKFMQIVLFWLWNNGPLRQASLVLGTSAITCFVPGTPLPRPQIAPPVCQQFMSTVLGSGLGLDVHMKWGNVYISHLQKSHTGDSGCFGEIWNAVTSRCISHSVQWHFVITQQNSRIPFGISDWFLALTDIWSLQLLEVRSKYNCGICTCQVTDKRKFHLTQDQDLSVQEQFSIKSGSSTSRVLQTSWLLKNKCALNFSTHKQALLFLFFKFPTLQFASGLLFAPPILEPPKNHAPVKLNCESGGV